MKWESPQILQKGSRICPHTAETCVLTIGSCSQTFDLHMKPMCLSLVHQTACQLTPYRDEDKILQQVTAGVTKCQLLS